MSDSKRPRSKVSAARAPRRGAVPESPPAARSESTLGSFFDRISDITTDLTSSALKLASLTRESAARAIARTPEQLRMMASAGESLRDMRHPVGYHEYDIFGSPHRAAGFLGKGNSGGEKGCS